MFTKFMIYILDQTAKVQGFRKSLCVKWLFPKNKNPKSLIVNMRLSPHSCLWFSAACSAVTAYKNIFFVLTNRLNLLNLKQSSDRLVIVAVLLLKLSRLHMLIR